MYPVNAFLSSYEYQGWTTSFQYELPHQGWKIHISATDSTYQTSLNHVAYLSGKLNFSFKFASSPKLIKDLLDVHGKRESGGKLITIYPKNQSHCLILLKILSNLLGGFAGPCVLSDRQFGKTNNISYRYGVFESKTSKLLLYEEKEYEDHRLPYFSLPPFIKKDPFEKYVHMSKSVDYHWEKLHIDGVYKFTLGGGIYYGTYGGKPIVLKEGRYGIGIGINQAIANRKNERQILELLQGKHFPEVLGSFVAQDNYYLIMKKVVGVTYYDYFTTVGPVVVEKTMTENAMSIFVEVIKDIISTVAYAHRKGVILRDINSANILVNVQSKKVYFVDCADSICVNSRPQEKIKTPWYTIPETKYNTYAEDWTKVAWLIFDGLGGVNRNLCLANYTQVREIFSRVLKYQGFSKKWLELTNELCSDKITDTKIMQLLIDPQLKKVQTRNNFKRNVPLLNFDKVTLNNYLFQALSSKDQEILEVFLQKSCQVVNKFIENMLNEFIIKSDMIYLKNTSVHSPYVNGGVAGKLYVLLALVDKFELVSILPRLEEILDKFSGRYVKNATLSSGAAGLGMLTLYTYTITGKEKYLQYAYKWNELVDVLSFSLGGHKEWSNYRFDARPDESFTNGNAGIRCFQSLLTGEKS